MVGLALALVASGCSSDAGTANKATAVKAKAKQAASGRLPLQGPTAPTEYVGLTTQIPVDRASFDRIASQLFGAEAAKGSYWRTWTWAPGCTCRRPPTPPRPARSPSR